MTLGTLTVNVGEATGFAGANTARASACVVVGNCSNLLGASAFFPSGAAAQASAGYGDAIDVGCQAIEQIVNGNYTNAKIPVAFYGTTGTVGGFGTLNTGNMSGTAKASVSFTGTAAATGVAQGPWGTYQIRVTAIGNQTLGTGNTGGYQYSADGGNTWSNTVNVGTGVTLTIPTTGVVATLGASGQTWASGDYASITTTPPTPTTSDLTAAFAAIAQSSTPIGVVAVEMNMQWATTNIAQYLVSGLNALKNAGKRVLVLARFRSQNSGETDAQYVQNFTNEFSGAAPLNDSRIVIVGDYGTLTDAMTNRMYTRTDFAQFLADTLRVPISTYPGSPSDVGVGGISNLQLVNSSGVLVGHDEGPLGSATGISTSGVRGVSLQRVAGASQPNAVYRTFPWTMFAPTDLIQSLMARRIANEMEMETLAVAIPALGRKLSYIPANPTTGASAQLTPQSINSLHATIYGHLAPIFAPHIQNAFNADLDTGLVQVSPLVTVSNGQIVSASTTLAPLMFGYLCSWTITLAAVQ